MLLLLVGAIGPWPRGLPESFAYLPETASLFASLWQIVVCLCPIRTTPIYEVLYVYDVLIFSTRTVYSAQYTRSVRIQYVYEYIRIWYLKRNTFSLLLHCM